MQSNKITTLVKRARERDAEAFTEVIQLLTADMYKVAYSILLNDEDAADAIQDTILTCWEKIHTLRKAVFFKTWLTRILINHCYDIRKNNQKVTYLEEYEEPVAEDERNSEFKEMLSVLDEKYRIVMVLFYEEGYKTGEIAKFLQLSPSTVQTRLQRGREKLADYYGDEV